MNGSYEDAKNLNAESIAVMQTTAGWVWDIVGKDLIKSSVQKAGQKWKTFRWADAESDYRRGLLEHISTTRILGNPALISIKNIYTDVLVLDKISAQRRHSYDDLDKQDVDFGSNILDVRRSRAEDVLAQTKRIYLLGKPGAGKTTFLKHLALDCCEGKIDKTPIFISLKEWADSNLDILAFITHQFDICDFPEALAFVEHILKSGKALVLFDGLDEVYHDGVEKRRFISSLSQFSKKYKKSTICLTCRIAAIDYSFDQFEYVEIADFNESQQLRFTNQWYRNDADRLKKFNDEWAKLDNAGLKELGRTPLLLALLCLAFDETLSFPHRRVELYAEALDALLKKWDQTRGIVRSDIYRRLSLERKKQLLSRVAAFSFECGRYLIRKEKLAEDVKAYLQLLPIDDASSDLDAEGVIQAIEAQHGLFVERAHNIYSFSHLTLQEYFTAKYMVENQSKDTTKQLAKFSVEDPRWREVALMSASLLSDGEEFILALMEETEAIIFPDPILSTLIKYISDDPMDHPSTAEFIQLIFTSAEGSLTNREKNQNTDQIHEIALDLSAEFAVWPLNTRPGATTRSRNLVKVLASAKRLGLNQIDRLIRLVWGSNTETERLSRYLRSSKLLVECLRLSALNNRAIIDNGILKILARNG